MSDNTNLEAPISVGSWIFMFIVQSIPVIGIILLIIWALDSSNRTRCNYARAIIVMGIICAFLGVAIVSLLIGMGVLLGTANG